MNHSLVIADISNQNLDEVIDTPIRMAQQHVERFHLSLME